MRQPSERFPPALMGIAEHHARSNAEAHHVSIKGLVEEADYLAGNVLSSRLLMVHNASTGRQNYVAELSRWQQFDDPLLEIPQLYIIPRRYDTSLVEATVQLNNNLAVAVVVNLLEFANVAYLRSSQHRSYRKIVAID